VCALAGIVCAILAWRVPAHLRAVDARVLRAAANRGWAVREAGLQLVRQNHPGAAEMLRAAARQENLPGSDELDHLLAAHAAAPPLTDTFIRTGAREQELAHLAASPAPAVPELLQTRALKSTKLFAPSASAAGQAFDAAVAIAGYLIDNNALTGSLRDALQAAAASANHGGDPEPLERFLVDFLSLGQRLNPDQAAVFVQNIQDAGTFSVLAEEARNAGAQLPTLFAAVQLSGQPRAVASYVQDFPPTGLRDIGASLRDGSGGLNELLRRHVRITGAVTDGPVNALDNFSLRQPALAVALKCLLYLLAGFLVAETFYYAGPEPAARERPLQVRGVHYAREVLFALGFLLVALLVSEPFLAQESHKMEMRLRLPTVGGPVAAGATPVKQLKTFMNQSTLLTLLLFFVLQALLYVACLVKLAEIKRQNALARVKIRLLENEEHLFDAGLYLGFCGTIVSLILVSLGIIEQSLMAAYSSTSFGIIFVSIFKIFQLRPAKRQLLLLAEEDNVNAELEVTRQLATIP
jgi:hypothetical protein